MIRLLRIETRGALTRTQVLSLPLVNKVTPSRVVPATPRIKVSLADALESIDTSEVAYLLCMEARPKLIGNVSPAA